jgi:hypothetical protein
VIGWGLIFDGVLFVLLFLAVILPVCIPSYSKSIVRELGLGYATLGARTLTYLLRAFLFKASAWFLTLMETIAVDQAVFRDLLFRHKAVPFKPRSD